MANEATPVNEDQPQLPENNGLPQTIRAFDPYGREVQVPRAEWSAQVLPNMIAEVWDSPDQLYGLIVSSLNDGFTTEVAAAAEHLALTDTIPARGASMWSAVLLQTGRGEEAEQLLTTYLASHEQDGSILLNLAKAQATRGDMPAAEATLFHALEVEPNLDNGLGWYVSMQAERAALAGIPEGTEPNQQAGERAAKEALERIAAMPRSWRAQLWLARAELAPNNPGARGTGEARGLAAARPLYAEALARAPRPVPPDFLMQMSGDLGGAGFLAALIDFTAPNFVPEVHGLPVGNNLIKAYVDTGHLTAAAALKDQLFALDRPDWRDALNFWDAEIASRRPGAHTATGTTAGLVPSLSAAAATPTSTRPELRNPATQPPQTQHQSESQPQSQSQPQPEIQIGLLRIDGPIWLPPHSPARPLFPLKPAQTPSVTFLGGTAESPEASPEISNTPSPDTQAPATLDPATAEALNRLTRSLPLFFAEQVELRTAAEGRALLPWAVAQPGSSAQSPRQPSGFVVSASPWPDAAAAQMVADPANRTDYVVTVHIDAEVEPWTVDLAFLRTSDGQRIGELSAEFPPTEPAGPLLTLADEIVDLLAVLGPATPQPSSQTDQPDQRPAYQLPRTPLFAPYLLRLEQLLAVRCANVPGAARMSLQGEREILDGQLDLALAAPENIPVRLLLVETYGALSQLRPEVAAQFQPNFLRLITEHPIPAIDAAFAPQQPQQV